MTRVAPYMRLVPGPSPMYQASGEARFHSSRFSLLRKNEVLRRFLGNNLNVPGHPGGVVRVNEMDISSISARYPQNMRAIAQMLFVGAREGLLFDISRAEWCLRGSSSVFTFCLKYSKGADLTQSQQGSEIDWAAVLANLRAYVLSSISANLHPQVDLSIRHRGNVVRGQLIVPN
jgi:hypothetical protein